MKIRPVGADLFHADRRTDRHDEANSNFSQFCERTYKRRANYVTTADILMEFNATHNAVYTETKHAKLRKICSSIENVSEKTVLSMKMEAVLGVTPCSSVNRYQRFGGT